MAGVKGRSGTNKGKDKQFADMIRLAVNEEDPVRKIRRLRLIADKVVDLAVSGESWAAQMVADRLDGKPVQQMEVGEPGDFDNMSSDELTAEIAEEAKALGLQVLAIKPKPNGRGTAH